MKILTLAVLIVLVLALPAIAATDPNTGLQVPDARDESLMPWEPPFNPPPYVRSGKEVDWFVFIVGAISLVTFGVTL